MKRKGAYIFMLLFFCQLLSAGGGPLFARLHPGVEWGVSPSLASFHHFNYLDESIGFRINDEGWTYPHQMNAFVLASLTFDLGKKSDICLLSGYMGLYKGRRTVPLVCRTTFYTKGKDKDGFTLFADAGMSARKNEESLKMMELGAGYHIVLAPRSSLEIRLGSRLASDRPDVWDPIEEAYISAHNIMRNDAWYYALNISIGLSF